MPNLIKLQKPTYMSKLPYKDKIKTALMGQFHIPPVTLVPFVFLSTWRPRIGTWATYGGEQRV